MALVVTKISRLVKRPCRLAWLTGPIVAKELRSASRQWKYHLLRLAYVGLLCLVIFSFWHTIVAVGGGGTGLGQVSRSGEVGKRVIVTIVWFQFITAQVLAIVLFSDALSNEVRKRTLEGLLVTPIGAVHIVAGKLVSRLLQIVLLLAISLPVLAVARAFGGVPWDYVVSALCITLSASVLAGTLSLCYSITYRHAYHTVLRVGNWYLFLMLVSSLLLGGVGVSGVLPQSRGSDALGAALSLLSVGFVCGDLGLFALRESVRTLRRDIYR